MTGHAPSTGAPFVSYAQNGEDVVLARALRPDEHTGFWIDVGAGDPVVDSVTAAFAERGWRGINIEPLPAEHQRLCAARPDDVNLRVALGAAPGRGRLFEGPRENRGSSTLVPEIAEGYQAWGQTFMPLDVTITTLADVVAEHAPAVVDFLKIDVEGFERDVLEGADWSSGFHPRVVMVEATEPNATRLTHHEWEPGLLEQGYRFAMFDGLNRFYASVDEPGLFENLVAPANVHDAFVRHAWLVKLDKARAAADAATVAERRQRDAMAMVLEEIAALRDDLDAAQRLTAYAVNELELARTGAAEAREAEAALEQLRAEHKALVNTRLVRYTTSVRKLYGRLRRPFTRAPAPERR